MIICYHLKKKKSCNTLVGSGDSKIGFNLSSITLIPFPLIEKLRFLTEEKCFYLILPLRYVYEKLIIPAPHFWHIHLYLNRKSKHHLDSNKLHLLYPNVIHKPLKDLSRA